MEKVYSKLETDNIITAPNEVLHSFASNITQHFVDLSTDDLAQEVIRFGRYLPAAEVRLAKCERRTALKIQQFLLVDFFTQSVSGFSF